MDELNISICESTAKNLRFLTERAGELFEARILELCELAEKICSDLAHASDAGLGVYEILELIKMGYPEFEDTVHSDALEENLKRLSLMLSVLNEKDKVLFSELIVEQMKGTGILISERDFVSSLMPDETFTYVKNVFSDEAYDVFSISFADPRVRYSQTLKDAVRAVKDGEVGYALLPFEERGGRIPSINEMIYQSDLRVASITPVFGQSAEVDLKYALVSKTLTVTECDLHDDRYLEVRIPKCASEALTGIILAAECYSLDIYRINTSSFDLGERKDEFYTLIFKGEGCDFTRMLTYLALFTDDFTVVGMYKNLE